MGLKEVLEKMKLVEIDESETPSAPMPRSPAGSPPPPPPRATSGGAARPGAAPPMHDVLKGAPKPAADDAAMSKVKTGSDALPDFESIYQASGVKAPPHGFTAQKVLEILSSPDFAALDARAKAAALSGFLKMNPTGPVA